MIRRLSRDILIIAIATGISRVFGLLRDVVIADRFGAGLAYDAFLVAFFVPHFLRRLLAEGALSTAFVPVYTDSLVNSDEADRFASNVLSLLLILFPIVVAAGILLAPIYLPFLASGFPGDQLSLTISLSRVIFAFIAFVGFAAAFMGILNAHHRFFAASFAPVLFNIGMIIGALFLAPLFTDQPIYGLAIGALIGGAGQLLIQLPALRRVQFHFHFTLLPLHPGVRKMLNLMAPSIIALAVAQTNLMVDNKLASHLAQGGISSLQYAMRLFQLPLGVFAVSIATALLPRFSRAVSQNDNHAFSSRLTEGIILTSFVLLPAMVGLYVIGKDVIQLLFEHGSFAVDATLRTTRALSFYLIGLLPYGMVFLFTRAYYATRRPLIPLVASSCAVATNVVLDLLLVNSMQEAGLALATSIAGIVNCLLLAAFLWTRFSRNNLTKNLGKVACGTLAVFAISLSARLLLADSAAATRVFVPLVLAIGSYLIYARITGLWNVISSQTAHLSE